MDRKAVVEPARDHRSRVELCAELDRDGDPSLVVHRVPVLAGEHRRVYPWYISGLGGSGDWVPHFSPLCATSMHSEGGITLSQEGIRTVVLVPSRRPRSGRRTSERAPASLSSRV